MNCEQCQQKIRDSLAAGESRPAPGVAAHENTCEACSRFHTLQRDLFHSIDIGLRSIANAPVPVSLLPGVRARQEQEPIPRHAVIPRWSFVAVAAILAVGIVYALHYPAKRFNVPQTISTAASQIIGNPRPSATPIREVPKASPSLASMRLVPTTLSTSAPPQIIVPPGELPAFSEFVDELPQQRDLALALTRPTAQLTSIPVDIALLRIEPLNVEPLDAAPSEQP